MSVYVSACACGGGGRTPAFNFSLTVDGNRFKSTQGTGKREPGSENNLTGNREQGPGKGNNT